MVKPCCQTLKLSQGTDEGNQTQVCHRIMPHPARSNAISLFMFAHCATCWQVAVHRYNSLPCMRSKWAWILRGALELRETVLTSLTEGVMFITGILYHTGEAQFVCEAFCRIIYRHAIYEHIWNFIEAKPLEIPKLGIPSTLHTLALLNGDPCICEEGRMWQHSTSFYAYKTILPLHTWSTFCYDTAYKFQGIAQVGRVL